MAARTRLHHQESVRLKIQASQLVNRLTDHVFGKVVLDQTQIKAIDILLKKSLPALSSIELHGDPENPLIVMQQSDQDIIRRYQEQQK